MRRERKRLGRASKRKIPKRHFGILCDDLFQLIAPLAALAIELIEEKCEECS